MMQTCVFMETCTLKRLALHTQGELRGCAEMAQPSVPPIADRAVHVVVTAAMKSVALRLLVRSCP
eukprot:7313610-Heterocapsa_arctica.AAC.1